MLIHDYDALIHFTHFGLFHCVLMCYVAVIPLRGSQAVFPALQLICAALNASNLNSVLLCQGHTLYGYKADASDSA